MQWWPDGAQEAAESDELSDSTVAVMPFEIRGGEDLIYLREGLVNLLSTKLDGAGALRTVDPRALISFISNRFPEGVDPQSAREVARHFGARRRADS